MTVRAGPKPEGRARVTWSRRLLLVSFGLSVVLLALFLASLGYEIVSGSARPMHTLVRRGDAVLRHFDILPRDRWSGYEETKGGFSLSDSENRTTFEAVTTGRPVYAFGIWPVGMNYTAREVRSDGPLEFSGIRLVWWSGDDAHVVDTADRSNGRLLKGSTSVEVRGWIPFEASRYGVEEFGTSFAPAAWREAWSDGSSD